MFYCSNVCSQSEHKASGIASGNAEYGPRALAESCPSTAGTGAIGPRQAQSRRSASSGDAQMLSCAADELLDSPYSLAYNRLLSLFPNVHTSTSARSPQYFNVFTHKCAITFSGYAYCSATEYRIQIRIFLIFAAF